MKRGLFLFARFSLGIIFLVFGLNGLFHFLPMTPPPAEATAFTADYFFPFVKIVQTFCGILFLINRYVPLAILIITPVIINIFLFHLFLDPANLPIAIALIILNIIVGFAYKDTFSQLWVANVKMTKEMD